MSAPATNAEIQAARRIVRSKYIIINHLGREVPLVFSPLLSHEQVAGLREVASAGYCKLDAGGRWVTGGGSESLELSARPQDAEILNAYLSL